jgi:hypothetical protein
VSGGNLRTLIKLAAVASVALPTMVALSSPASAQGLFDFLFGGFRQEAPATSSYADPRDPSAGAGAKHGEGSAHGSGGAPTVAFCVRTCDGKYFPMATHSHASAVETCNSFCPASETAVYRGSNIDNASDARGHRYASLENAFAYRKQVVAGCSCNGKSNTGLSKVDVKEDPTLRKGDIVATEDGFVAYTGSRDNVAQFTPAPDYKGLGKNTQRTLSETKIRDSRETVGSASSADDSEGRRAALQ